MRLCKATESATSRLVAALPLMLSLTIGLVGAESGPWWDGTGGDQVLPLLRQVFGEGAESAWELPPPSKSLQYGPAQDDLLQRPVLDLEGPGGLLIKGRTLYGSDTEVRCRVRLMPTEKRQGVSFTLNLAKDVHDPRDQGLRLYLYARYNSDLLGLTVSAPHKTVSQSRNLKPYPVISPVLPESIRLPIEEAMSEAPGAGDRWVDLRCQVGTDWARVWVDDRLLLNVTEAELRVLRDEQRQRELAKINALADEEQKVAKLKAFKEQKLPAKALPTSGHIQAALSPSARLAELKVRARPQRQALYETVALDGYVRDHELLGKPGTGVADGSVPFGKTVTVAGIPFQFTDRTETGGPDHLDIGRSLLRQGNMEGYHQSNKHRFAGTSYVDPARLQLRIPNGRYDAMYVIAAFDEEKSSIPVVSASFYRPGAGFAKVFETTVPSYRAREAEASPLPVRLENGRKANLWLVKMPLDPAALASFSDLDTLEVELTKKVHQHRSYPDPYIYGWHQGGLPSGVHVYAVTLHRPDVHLALESIPFGHVWVAGQRPTYRVTLENRTDEPRTVELVAQTKSHDGQEETEQTKTVKLLARRSAPQTLYFTVKKHGIHTLRLTMKDGDQTWTEERNFAVLAPDTRSVRYEPGKGPMFGFWSYAGGHYTPPGREHYRLMALAGARGPAGRAAEDEYLKNLFEKHNFQRAANAWPVSPQWGWAGEENLDMEKYRAYSKTAVEKIRKVQGDHPDFVTFYPEPHISQRLTAGNLPEYWGEEPYEYTEHEKRAIRVFFNTSKAAAEGVRKAWPKTKILIPWGDPLFIPPLLRAGFPKDLIDGSGLDMIGFERLPEQQIHQQSTHRLYILKEEYRKFGLENPFLPYIEGTFVPTEPGACTWDEQANRYHRWSLISLAYGITHFFSGWFAFDCGNYYGAEHYGGCGIQRRIPYADPKPAYVHYATMTRMLDRAKFDKWLPTGSHSTYCLKFAREQGGPVYALWTLRGKRPVTLTLANDATVTVTDSMDNGTPVASKESKLSVGTGPSPVYVTGADDMQSATAGAPDHRDALEWAQTRNQQTWHTGPVKAEQEIQMELRIGSLGDGTWQLQPTERDELYETNNYDTARYHGDMSARLVSDPERQGLQLAVRLEKQEKERKLMPWYTVIRAKKPVTIPGKARQLLLWVKAHSDWGRVVYCLRDAKDERWVSIGTKDQWNCDDVHSWSCFNFDGWRPIHFELPSHSAYDSFREYGTTWWRNAGGDGIVDLPLRIEKIIVERRTHLLYVNDVQPANPDDVLLGDLLAAYTSDFDSTEKAVAQNRIRMELPEPPASLPNAIDRMAEENPLPATKLHKVTDPDWGYDGTRGHVHFDEVEGAAQYQIWVAALPDGRGAVAMGRMNKSGGLLGGLRPATDFYLWVTYTDKTQGKGKDQKQSKPSNALRINLVDAFGQK